MKFIRQDLEAKNTRWLWKESVDEYADVVAEKVKNPVENLAQENREDVESVLNNEKPKNLFRRMWEKTKKFFKHKILGVTEVNYEKIDSASEGEEVLKNRSTGEIKSQFLYKTNDIFEFLMAFETCAKRSDIALRDRYLLQTVNRLAGQEIFADNDWQNLSDNELEKKFYNWVKNTPELGEAKAELWKQNFLADNMAAADGDYFEYVDKNLGSPEEFSSIVSESLADFASPESDAETLSRIDKGFVMAHLRLTLKRRKLNNGLDGDFVLQSLIYGAAIGFISKADLVRMNKEFGESMPLLNVFANASFEEFKQWATDLNSGKVPVTAKEFTEINPKNWQKLYFEQWSQSEHFDTAFNESFVPNIMKADYKDMSLWAHKLSHEQLNALLQATSDSKEKLAFMGWEELLKGFVVSLEQPNIKSESLLKNALLLTETLTGNYTPERSNTVKLEEISPKMAEYRDKIHAMVKEVDETLNFDDKEAVKNFIESGQVEGSDKKEENKPQVVEMETSPENTEEKLAA
ncbi:hypothetical protein CSB37_01195 [bacterium DOLZORAL124_38_8]|nr:MAG: hypothetical protein CSB37_01195 [bacterium DOLZORAL124_38_8]